MAKKPFEIIKVYCAPTKFTCASYGTVLEEVGGSLPLLYIQTSTDEAEPQWERLGSFLEFVHRDKLTEVFIDNALMIYREKHSKLKKDTERIKETL